MIIEKLNKRINILLGKNGSGKSILLRKIEAELQKKDDCFVKYITPERGGELSYSSAIEENIIGANKNWLRSTRDKNRFDQFRQQTVTQFRILQSIIQTEIENDLELRKDFSYTFNTIVNKINDLLPLIKIIRTPSGFEIKRKKGDQVIKADLISSGESEAIALSIEALVFSRECQTSTNRLLLIDEPDVHLHPDLQVRFIRFLEDLAKEKNFKVLIATHSTSVISALKFKTECQVAFMPLDNGDEIKFSEINNIIQSVVPIFGAHPLSNLFNEAPIMLVEGDDDKRIWDQVKRTSEGKVPIFPCSVDGKGEMSKWENWLVDFLSSIYDEPKAYSLRDNDGCSGEIEDKPPIIRMRLHCRTVENLLLTDECFILSGLSWDTFKDNCIKWAKTHASHSHFSYMTSFIDKGFDRKNHDLKKIRNIIVYLMGVSKPWEVLVGQAIVSAMNNNKKISSNSMLTYLGEKVQKNILCL